MKIDLYTKVILTVIALCLIYIVAKDVPFISEAKAQLTVKEQIDAQQEKFEQRRWDLLKQQTEANKIINVNIVSIAGKEFSETDVGGSSPSIPVKVKNNVMSIGDTIPVKIEKY